MKTFKQVEKLVDKLVDELKIIARQTWQLKNCTIYTRSGDFSIAVAKNGKKFVINTGDDYSRFSNFDGCLLGKYNVAVYKLTYYMVDMDLLTEEEAEMFRTRCEQARSKEYEDNKLRDAMDLLNRSGYAISKK